MVPLLLLLLLHESQAGKVCFNISNNIMHVTLTDGDVLDGLNGYNVTCKTSGFSCFILCTTYNNETWFNGSSACLEADEDIHLMETKYRIHNYSTCRKCDCNPTVILKQIDTLCCETCNQEEVVQLHYIKISCPNLFESHSQVRKDFIKAEKHLIHNIMATSKVQPGSSKNYNLKAFSLNVFNISEAALNSPGEDSRLQIEAPPLPTENMAAVPEVWLPVNALRNIPENKRVIGLVSYMQHSHFQFHEENLSSMVLRIEILRGQLFHNLNPPLEMIFNNMNVSLLVQNDSQLLCYYFNERVWHWKPDGCTTYKGTKNNHGIITCHCNHTTPFAVLLIRQPIAEAHWRILSYLSYIGCGLSAFFTALSLVMYVFMSKHKLDYSISIHVSLSGALFLLNSAFLLTEWGATVEQEWVCVFVAAFMHYSLLCCFTWMAIEALHLYLLLIKVFNTYYKRYLLKLSLGGWGIPGIIVAVSLGMKDFKQFYGVTVIAMADTNQTSSICWITDDSFFYSLNLVYFTLTFIFNSGILMTVASSICRMKQMLKRNSKRRADAEKFSASCRSGLTVFGLTCLMGITWGLAFLGSGYVNYPILYLFCILNSTQGFFIFLWICLTARKQRMKAMEDRMASNPVKTSEIKSD